MTITERAIGAAVGAMGGWLIADLVLPPAAPSDPAPKFVAAPAAVEDDRWLCKICGGPVHCRPGGTGNERGICCRCCKHPTKTWAPIKGWECDECCEPLGHDNPPTRRTQ